MGRTSGRQWGNPMAASGENYMATVIGHPSGPLGTYDLVKRGQKLVTYPTSTCLSSSNPKSRLSFNVIRIRF
jgi:hypothetical protein